MSDDVDADLCVIGGGSGGLSVAAGAVQMGARVVLIERGRMGGDCLNYGCVPSKALLAAAHAAQGVREAGRFGVNAGEPAVDGAAVFAHVRRAIAAIAPHDSVERFEGLGVRVIQASARFTGPDRLEAGGVGVRARRFVIATGSSPLVPPIPGLDAVSFLTNETVFDLDRIPNHLVILGGGPIGVEMAQAFRQLGARVSVVEMASILGQDDPELVAVVRQRLTAHGIALREQTRAVAVRAEGSGIALAVEDAAGRAELAGSHLLVAVGRRPSVAGLDLEAAQVAYGPKGIAVDDGLRTSNRRIFAIGDVAGRGQFTHLANHHASVVIKRALFRLPAKVETAALPWVTYTDPELAQVGLSEAKARAAGHAVEVLRWPFAKVDRARAEDSSDGLLKAVVTKKGRVLGCGIVGPRAGDLIALWGVAIRERIKLGAIAQTMVPYPTFAEISRLAAGSFFTPLLTGARTRFLVRLLARLG